MNICLWSFTNQSGVKVWQVHANGQPLMPESVNEYMAWKVIFKLSDNPRNTLSKWDDVTQVESIRLPIRDAIAREA